MNIEQIIASMAIPPASLVTDENKAMFWSRVVAHIIDEHKGDLEGLITRLYNAVGGEQAVLAVLAMQIAIVRIERASRDFKDLPGLMRAIRTAAEDCNDYMEHAEAAEREARG